jgi:hypothetical protein
MEKFMVWKFKEFPLKIQEINLLVLFLFAEKIWIWKQTSIKSPVTTMFII